MQKKIIFCICVIGIISLVRYHCLYDNNQHFQGKQIESAYDDIFEEQSKIDKEIEGYKKSNEYTINNPKVMLNPYKISPLTALVIFQTEEEESIDIEINQTYSTTIEASKEHIIPIYGMYPDYENKISLRLSSGTHKEITIKTQVYEGDPITIETTTKEVADNLYFISPNFVNDCIIDGKGNVIWYLLGDYAGDIEFLENGHFYISDCNQGRNGVKINYSSFVEMDYLGKIYNQWITEYGLHHELIPLADNKMMVLGANDKSNFFDSYIYIMDLKTSQIIKSIDLYELLYNIDPELVKSLGTNFDLVNNSADYNEETGDLVISLRGLNSLMKLNFHTKEIKWIFGNPEFWGEKFSKYMLKVTDTTRFLGGQHAAFVTEDGLIGVHNNDINQFDLSNSNLTHYLNRYTTCDLYQVNEENKTIKTVWQYTANKELFSNVGGHIEILEDNSKLITYGWAMKKEAYENPEGILYTDPNYKNGVIVQIDKNNQIQFKATIPGLIYRTFKIDKIYKKNSNNYKLEPFHRINGTAFKGQTIKTSKIAKNLAKASKYQNKFELITNRASIYDNFESGDVVDILFVGEKEVTYVYSYKQANKEAPKSFNSGLASIQTDLPLGKYAVYIKKNNHFYDVTKVIEF